MALIAAGLQEAVLGFTQSLCSLGHPDGSQGGCRAAPQVFPGLGMRVPGVGLRFLSFPVAAILPVIHEWVREPENLVSHDTQEPGFPT